jgi:hypothetical protein
VYAAEKHFIQATKSFNSREELEAFVAEVTGTRWWRNNAERMSRGKWDGSVRVFYTAKQGATGWAYTTGMPKVRFCENRTDYIWSVAVVLHELAHVITPNTFSTKNGIDVGKHGPLYCRNYLTLVKWALGESAAKFLQWSFDAHGVNYRSPKGARGYGLKLHYQPKSVLEGARPHETTCPMKVGDKIWVKRFDSKAYDIHTITKVDAYSATAATVHCYRYTSAYSSRFSSKTAMGRKLHKVLYWDNKTERLSAKWHPVAA